MVRPRSTKLAKGQLLKMAGIPVNRVYVYEGDEPGPVGSRRILHFNVTQHPSAEWTLQQLRECVTGEEPYKFIIHDRDSIYSENLDVHYVVRLESIEDALQNAAGEFIL